jgi:hypothetical protein
MAQQTTINPQQQHDVLLLLLLLHFYHKQLDPTLPLHYDHQIWYHYPMGIRVLSRIWKHPRRAP